jgi:hypothetical protein
MYNVEEASLSGFDVMVKDVNELITELAIR